MNSRKIILSAVMALAFLNGRPAFFCAPVAASAQRPATAQLPSKPYPARLVNDMAGVLPRAFSDSLETALVAFDDSTSNQIAVVTVSNLGGRDVAEYALRLGNEWGVGSSLNNGVVILLKPRGADGFVDITIQVGRGLEGAVPDAYASRIIRNIMGPYLKRDEYTTALALGCREIQALAAGEISQPRDNDGELEYDDYVDIIVVLIFITIIIISIIRRKRGGNDADNNSGGSGGGGPIFIPFGGRGGRGGGFFGGGGGFGGFGGGSFGGGGASGRF